MTNSLIEHKQPSVAQPGTRSTPRQTQSARAKRIARKLAFLDELDSLLATVPQDAPPLRDDAVARSYAAKFDEEPQV